MSACLGSRLDTDILLRLFSANQEAIAAFIDDAAQANLILFDNTRRAWCFSHDYVQEKIYNLIPVNERYGYHYRIGRKLWREFDLDELGNFLFIVVGQLLLGIECIKDRRERVAVAKLCLGAGVRAVKFSNFQSSYMYLKSGIFLLNNESWKDEYDLMINLHNAAAEVANSLGIFADVDVLVEELLVHCKTYDDTYRARATQIHALGRNGKMLDAINAALKVLEDIGEKISTNQSSILTFMEVSYLRWRVRGKTNEMILRIPNMTNPKKLAAMETMNLIFLYTSLVQPELMPMLGCRMVRLSLDYGLSAISCVGFVVFAATVAGTGQSFDEADRLGTLGFLLLQKFDANPWLARISSIYYQRIFGWVRPFADCRLPLIEAHYVGLQYGDTEFAVGCILHPLLLEFEARPLPEFKREFNILFDRMRFYGLKHFEIISESIQHFVVHLSGSYDGDSNALKKMIVDDRCDSRLEASNIMKKRIHLMRALQFYLYGFYELAMSCARDAYIFVTQLYGPCRGSFAAIICGLVDVAYAKQMKHRQASHAKKYSKLLLRWALAGEPRNFIGKHYLLEAELAALAGKKALSYKLYISAISACLEGKLLFSTAIACEQAARFLREWGKNDLAGPYFREAVALYAEWGATKKMQHLQLEIIQLGF